MYSLETFLFPDITRFSYSDKNVRNNRIRKKMKFSVAVNNISSDCHRATAIDMALAIFDRL